MLYRTDGISYQLYDEVYEEPVPQKHVDKFSLAKNI